MSRAPWIDKAERLIASLSLDAYRTANPIPRKRHKPYTIPPLARELVECIGTNDEHRAKRLFLSYDGLNAI